MQSKTATILTAIADLDEGDFSLLTIALHSDEIELPDALVQYDPNDIKQAVKVAGQLTNGVRNASNN